MSSSGTEDAVSNRIGIFHFFDERGHIDDYVFHNLEELKKVCSTLILTVNGDIDEGSRARIESLGIQVMVRENRGFDFGAWKDAILEKWKIIEQADELVLTNDSYYGPFFPWSDVFAEMDQKECDFWGLTSRGRYKGMEGNVPEHIQSYFLTIRKRMLSSRDFRDYWESLGYAETFKECVDRCEGLFTEHFSKLGYTWKIFCDIPDSSRLDSGLFEYDTDELVIFHRLPVIKRKSLISDTGERIQSAGGEAVMRLFDHLDSRTDYDRGMILDNIIRTCPLTVITDTLPNHVIITGDEIKIDGKSAIFFHIDSNNDCQYYAEHINEIPPDIDVFMVVKDQQSIGDMLSSIKREYEMIQSDVCVDRISGSVLAKMMEYEYACIIRDSETVSENYYGIDSYPSQRSLRNIVWDNLIGNAGFIENIIRIMSDNRHIGLMFPPCPDHDEYRILDRRKWTELISGKKAIIDDLKIDERMVCDYPDAFPLCFWCRTVSITGVTENTPIQLLPLVCQKNGYVPAISISTDYASLKIRNCNSISNTVERMEKEKVIKFFLKHNYVFKVLKKVLR